VNELLWFLLFFTPAYVANMAPPFFRKLPFSHPIDGGRTWRGKSLLGKNKTWRGLVVGTLAGGLTGYVLAAIGLPFVAWWGFVLGFTALVGDALKSFVKRQMNFKPGESWVPFDQLDFLFAAYLASIPLITFDVWSVVIGFIIIFVGTVIVQVIGGATGIKANKL
jgi:CDP-2,3-bis-(O-geranylgeranyl)-sn-glycerol synthase